MNDPREEQGDVLAQLAEAFAGQTVPPGPDEAMKQRLIVALERQSNRSTADDSVKPWRRWTMRKAIGIAAILLVMVAVGGFFGSRRGSPGAAFAAMIEQIKEIRSVRFLMRTEMKGPNAPPNLKNMEMTFTSMVPWTRVEGTVAGEKVVRIANTDQHKVLMLFENAKAYLPSDEQAGPAGPEQSNFVDKLRGLSKDGAKYLGTEKLEGVEALKYRYESGGDFYTLWVDPISKLPIRIGGSDPGDESLASVAVTYSNFEWNVPINAGFFTLEPPAGYTLSPNADK